MKLPQAALCGGSHAGKGLRPDMFRMWDYYGARSWVPRLGMMFSKRGMSNIVSRSDLLTWQHSLPKMRMDLVITGWKVFEGQSVLLEKEHSQPFPQVNTTAGLFEPRGTLVVMTEDAIPCEEARQAIEEWKTASPYPVQHLQVMDTASGWARAAITASLPEGTHHCSTWDGRPLYHLIAAQNRLVPYVFLVDDTGRIRWRSSWKPTEREKDFLKEKWSLE